MASSKRDKKLIMKPKIKKCSVVLNRISDDDWKKLFKVRMCSVIMKKIDKTDCPEFENYLLRARKLKSFSIPLKRIDETNNKHFKAYKQCLSKKSKSFHIEVLKKKSSADENRNYAGNKKIKKSPPSHPPKKSKKSFTQRKENDVQIASRKDLSKQLKSRVKDSVLQEPKTMFRRDPSLSYKIPRKISFGDQLKVQTFHISSPSSKPAISRGAKTLDFNPLKPLEEEKSSTLTIEPKEPTKDVEDKKFFKETFEYLEEPIPDFEFDDNVEIPDIEQEEPIEVFIKDVIKETIDKAFKRSEMNQIIPRILNDTLRSVVSQKQRWLCPICGRFDGRNMEDINEVKDHIVRRHGEYMLDVNPKDFRVSLKGYVCNICKTTEHCFGEDVHGLLQHLAYDHNLLASKLVGYGIDPKQYLPILSKSRIDNGKRLRWKCLRCPHLKYVDKKEFMIHAALFHYFHQLFPVSLQSVEGEFIRNGHYTCTQIGCGQTYKTLQALIVHEEMKHNALELYLGTIIENDLYEPLNRNNM